MSDMELLEWKERELEKALVRIAELEAELAALKDLLGSISVHHPHLVPDLEEFCSEWRARP